VHGVITALLFAASINYEPVNYGELSKQSMVGPSIAYDAPSNDPTLLFLTNFGSGTTTPRVAKGSGAATFARSTAATFRTCSGGVTTISTASTNVARFETDCSGVVSYLSEGATTNLAVQSDDFATSWTAARMTVATNTANGPSGAATLDSLIPSVDANSHAVGQSITLTAATYTFSMYARAGANTWVSVVNNTIANGRAYFNLSTCVVGSKEAGIIESWAVSQGGGLCRYGFSFTGTAAGHIFSIQPAETEGDIVFAGDGTTVGIYAGGVQVALENYFSSYIATTTTSVNRGADSLSYVSTGNVSAGQGAIVCQVMLPNYNNAATLAVIDVNDATAANAESVYVSSSDVAVFQSDSSSSTQATVTGSTDITSGQIRTLAGSWATNDFRLYVGGASEGTPDTSGTPTSTMTKFDIGHARGSSQLNGNVLACGVYSTSLRAVL
jgi:hypothetical protein